MLVPAVGASNVRKNSLDDAPGARVPISQSIDVDPTPLHEYSVEDLNTAASPPVTVVVPTNRAPVIVLELPGTFVTTTLYEAAVLEPITLSETEGGVGVTTAAISPA